MNYVGISCGFHDAALSVIDDNGNILFAGRSEHNYQLLKNKQLHEFYMDFMT